MAILGGNLELVQWLASERYCPLRVALSTRKKNSSLDNHRGGDTSMPLVTSKGRSPIHLALQQSRLDILRYLVADKKLSLLEEVTEEADVKFALRHLTFLLQVAPDSNIQATGRLLENRSSYLVKEEAHPIMANVPVEQVAPFASCYTVPPTMSQWMASQYSSNDSIASSSTSTSTSTERRGSF
jgi:hypothetical protein